MWILRELRSFGKLRSLYKYMKILTIITGCALVITTFNVLVRGLSESLMFADLVGIRWSNQSSVTDGYLQSFTTPQYQLHVFGIVIDAGSTGTRIHIYKFSYDFQDGKQVYNLIEEALDEVRPGLSSYATDPRGARPGLERLFNLARKRVPAALTGFTHVTVRATAGLRLLPPSAAAALLNEAKDCVKANGFIVDRVDVMDGLEEAVQAWVTVNYLLQRLRSPRLSLGVMDLGGASTQITFVPMDKRTLSAVPKDHKHNLTVGGQSVEVYTHSYLGLGLMSARLALLTPRIDLHDSMITSPCVPLNYQGHWTHGGVRYTVTSVTAPGNLSTFDVCYARSRSLVTEQLPVVHLPELRHRRFYLFSYFYDRVKDAGLVPDNLPRGQITVDDYRQLAIAACSSNRSDSHRKPFLCLDLIYIYALLKDGYRLESSTSFYLAKKINNIELGWSLGVVFDLLYRTELVSL